VVGMGSGHSLGHCRREGPGMLVGTFQRTPWPHSPPSPRWEQAFKECCIPRTLSHSVSCGCWTTQRFPHWESCKLSLEKFAKRTFPWPLPTGGPGYARRNIPTNPLAAQSSLTEVGTGFQRVLHSPNPVPQHELWVLDHPALSPLGKLQTLP